MFSLKEWIGEAYSNLNALIKKQDEHSLPFEVNKNITCAICNLKIDAYKLISLKWLLLISSIKMQLI